MVAVDDYDNVYLGLSLRDNFSIMLTNKTNAKFNGADFFKSPVLMISDFFSD